MNARAARGLDRRFPRRDRRRAQRGAQHDRSLPPRSQRLCRIPRGRGKTPLEASDADIRAFQAEGGARGSRQRRRWRAGCRRSGSSTSICTSRASAATIRRSRSKARAAPGRCPKTLSVAEVERLIATAREGLDAPERTARERLATARMACLIELLYATGLRVSELIALPKSRGAREGAADRGARQGRQGAARAALRARARGDAALSRAARRDFARRARRARGCFPPTARAAICRARLSRAI